MALSVLCITRGPGPRVAALLALLRPVAAELVVAADERAAAADVSAYAMVADRVVRFPHDGSERHLAWAHELCREPWILRIDDDELPSAALLARLPSLAAEREVDQIWIPRRWVAPDGAGWLAEPPWWPDPQNRLVRRDAERRFSGVLHTAAESSGPALWIEEPLYHLDLALNDVATRRAKARRYLAGSRGLQAPGGGDIGASYYVPERRSRLAVLPLPAADGEAIARALAPLAPVAGAPRASVEAVAQADVDRAWVGRTLPESGYDAELAIVAAPATLAAGSDVNVIVRVGNRGSDRWERALDGPPFIRLATAGGAGRRWSPRGRARRCR